jgi:NMD protein affecting ribosome stability and mRNA decay
VIIIADHDYDLEECRMKEPSKSSPPRVHRQDRLLHERVHDPYKSKSKLPDPSVCPQCGAVFHEGRWTWLAHPPEAHEEICPACQRLRDKYPAGFLTVGGRFFQGHRDEILNLARNEEQAEKAEHPLHRIMQIDDRDDGVLITTTDIHLPRRIGEALRRAYQGEVDFRYVEEGSMLRVRWHRDA